MGSFTFNLPDPSDSAKTEDLEYRGSDPIVWDRINAQRLKRGLTGLAGIGLPRPADDATGDTGTFAAPGVASNSVTIKGPPGLTEAQARQIFQQQLNAGSFVGLRSGQSISALTQAAGGLATSQAQAAQSLRDLSGLSVNPSLAAKSLETVTGKISSLPVTNGITAADFGRSGPALTNIAQISPQQVQASLGQAQKLTGQNFDQVSNAAGLGKYGFGVQQLESAGAVKPGTAARYIQQGVNTITDVLKSPAVWTGKNGINNQADLLASAAKQDLLQTDLMAQGVAGLKSAGVPTNLLSSASLAGTALAAAKSVGATLDFLQGKSLPSVPGLPSTGQLDGLLRDGAFAASFAKTKISPAMAQEFPALPAVGTVNRATLNAATGRIVGNDKIPSLDFSVSALPTPSELTDQLNDLYARFQDLREDAGFLEQRMARIISGFDTRPENRAELYDAVEQGETLLADLEGIKSQLLALRRRAEARDPPDTGTISSIENLRVDQTIKVLEAALERARQRLDGALRV